jgi:RND family efflux transporter MFP subunit
MNRQTRITPRQRIAALTLIIATIAVTSATAYAPEDTALQGPAHGAVDSYRRPLVGLVQPAQQVTIASPVDGPLMELRVTEGQAVKAGEVLAIVDNRVMQASVALARVRAERSGALRDAELALANAERIFENHRQMRAREAVTETELHDAQMVRDRAQAQRDIELENRAVAAADLALQQQRLDALTMRAPFDGRIVRVWVREGEMLETATPVLKLIALETLEAEINVPAELYGKLTAGGDYTLVADAPIETPLTARLRFVSPVIDPSSRTIRCVFDIDNPDEQLPSGFAIVLPVESIGTIAAEPDAHAPR